MRFPEKCRFRGKEMYVQDALMVLTRDEFAGCEVTAEDGHVYYPFRDYNPPMDFTEPGVAKL